MYITLYLLSSIIYIFQTLQLPIEPKKATVDACITFSQGSGNREPSFTGLFNRQYSMQFSSSKLLYFAASKPSTHVV